MPTDGQKESERGGLVTRRENGRSGKHTRPIGVESTGATLTAPTIMSVCEES